MHAAKLQPGVIVFGFVGDEETGMLTAKLIADHPWVANAEFAINTDAGSRPAGRFDRQATHLPGAGAEKTYASPLH
ncbi:MAG: hypothetical protein IPF84_16435 [Proteobacteria bacterium]|nr:hypothetical protein [Pseudomonadota bacterium]